MRFDYESGLNYTRRQQDSSQMQFITAVFNAIAAVQTSIPDYAEGEHESLDAVASAIRHSLYETGSQLRPKHQDFLTVYYKRVRWHNLYFIVMLGVIAAAFHAFLVGGIPVWLFFLITSVLLIGNNILAISKLDGYAVRHSVSASDTAATFAITAAVGGMAAVVAYGIDQGVSLTLLMGAAFLTALPIYVISYLLPMRWQRHVMYEKPEQEVLNWQNFLLGVSTLLKEMTSEEDFQKLRTAVNSQVQQGYRIPE